MSNLSRYAVIDVETTGFSNRDRIIEIAVVVLDSSGDVVDEYDTLVDPRRDVGPSHIHGISASMVSAAPTFEEVAASIASRIDGAAIVAHNLAFDARFLANEFQSVEAELDRGNGVCTLRLSGEKLPTACARFGIPLTDHHRALADARATASLLKVFLDETGSSLPASVRNLRHGVVPRTHRREACEAKGALGPLARLVAKSRYPTSDGGVLCYLNALDWALDDLAISSAEASELALLAFELGLNPTEIDRANRGYLDVLIAASLRDGIVTAAENEMMRRVAVALGVTDMRIPDASSLPKLLDSSIVGHRVCFTGAATRPNGRSIDREELEAAAASAGLQPVGGVSKKGCDLLVAADPASGSGKAALARKHGIPILSVAEFLDRVGMIGEVA